MDLGGEDEEDEANQVVLRKDVGPNGFVSPEYTWGKRRITFVAG